ncbi:ketose-bisphosphate aldolase [Sporanaerobium hydrogeniformans]|uniref:Ketose-bisphosphate aldolase n=1 Tax=Sporanaerobium hydrogeniformans TaxID=3072179 RepID=A0AC61D9J9_9FIRM|nr:class II fructose-bisphosphate aldolase [Sporanaerobium hydrogeniformans]PHV70059.1 ketose-bisphosphate aldolase [Sporanaerobium hydrogeniformans]
MLVTLKEVMKDALEKGYAVGAFNVCNLESAMAIVQAAEEMDKAVILNFAEVHSPFLSMEIAANIMLYFAKKAKVPVCVHLDHGTSIESCIKAIQLGFTSVMIDASSDDYEKNVTTTAEVVKLAHSVGVTVEAELGHIFSSDIGVGESAEKIETVNGCEDLEGIYTNPILAKDFVERTGVDALAIAFGTSHGIYTTKPVLDLNRITKIRKQIDIPFVMHGGSGLSKEEFQTAIKNGVRKINYYTYMTLAGGKAVKESLDKIKSGDNIFFHDIPLIGIKAMKENVKEAIRMFSMM